MADSLEEIQNKILDRLHAGEAVDREQVLSAHPDLADDLRPFFDLLDVIEERPATDAAAPTQLGEFRILREIGRGGMGIVYEAEQTSLRRTVALKVLPPTLRMDPRLVSRFRREAEAAGRLRHPGIVPVYSVGETAGAPFFAMELVEGETLESIILRRKQGDHAGRPEDPEEWRRWCVEIVAQVANALAYAHGNGILHRDVKPGNVIVEESGVPRLTDFGLALDMHAPGLTLAGEIFGSPQYMSPEQAVRQELPVNERTDVYSLAVTLYELLTLRLPYDATTSAELLTALAAGRVLAPRRVDPDLPPALERVLLRALRKDPRERYAGPAAFAEDLRAAVEGRPVAAPSRPRWVRRTAVAAVSIILLLFVVAFLPDSENGSGMIREDGRLIDPPPAGKRVDPVPSWQNLKLRLQVGLERRDVGFWLDVEEALRMSLPVALPVEVMVRSKSARTSVQTFLVMWRFAHEEGEDANLCERLEQELRALGPAAAPHVLDALAANPYEAFTWMDPERGVTAAMQVNAIYAASFLELREAIPHLILHCRGPSMTAASNAALVLQKLTGEEFDAAFLKEVDLVKVDWWAKQRKASFSGLRHLVEAMLREMRVKVEADPKWWTDFGKLMVRDLGTLLDTRFPFAPTGDPARLSEQIDRIEKWWRDNQERFVR